MLTYAAISSNVVYALQRNATLCNNRTLMLLLQVDVIYKSPLLLATSAHSRALQSFVAFHFVFVTFHISSACLLSLFQLISTWFARQMQQHKMKTSFEHRSIICRELSCDREIFWALLSMWHEARTAVQHVCSLVMNWCCYTIIFTINSNCITATLLWPCASQRPSFRSRFLTHSSQFIAVWL